MTSDKDAGTKTPWLGTHTPLIPITLNHKTTVWRKKQMIKQLLLAAAVVCGPAHAQFYSGNELLQRIQGDSVVEKMVALGFVAGVSDAWDGIMFCPPDTVTTGQARDIALRFLIINPAKRHKPAAELVMDALMEAWPCARKPNKGGKL